MNMCELILKRTEFMIQSADGVSSEAVLTGAQLAT